MITTILFDFGGVIAEEGWRNGIAHIAKEKKLDFDPFFARANELLLETGWMYGNGTEEAYWDAFRKEFNIIGTNGYFRDTVLSRFLPRAYVLKDIKLLREQGYTVAILSDQTNWLEELNERYKFYSLFNKVYNSYRLGKGKHDATIFDDVVKELKSKPSETLFIDDNEGHIGRAKAKGLQTIHFTDKAAYMEGMRKYFI